MRSKFLDWKKPNLRQKWDNAIRATSLRHFVPEPLPGKPLYSGPDLVMSDTARLSQRCPPIAHYGFIGVWTWPIECDTPSPFLSISPVENDVMRSGGAIPPHNKRVANGTAGHRSWTFGTPKPDRLQSSEKSGFGQSLAAFGISAILAQYHMKTRQNGCDTLFEKTKYPNLLFLAFLDFLAFFFCKEFLAFLIVFPLFPKNFRGSEERKNPCFFGGFPCLFLKKQGKEDQGDWCPNQGDGRKRS